MTLETANRLYELRKKNNLSQEELAERLGVSRQAVSKWERSEASPDTDNLIALAKIYNLTLDELVYGEKEEKEKESKENPEAKNENEPLFIDIDDGEDKVKIGPDGILVEEKNGNKVKININEKLMKKIIEKIEDSIDDYDIDEDDDDDDKTVSIGAGHIIINTDNRKKKRTRFWLEVPYAVICAIAYLLFGFYNICGGWALSWIIFVTIPVYYTLVEAIYDRKFTEFCYPVFCACIYLYLGMYHGNWHPSWLIFVTIPVYYPIAAALDKMIRNH